MDWLRSAARRADKFARLGAAEKWLTIRIVGLLILVRVSLWTMPFQHVQRMAAWLGNRRARGTARKLTAEQLTSLISVTADYVPGASCLTQALVAQAILRRYGYEPVLKIGVTRSVQAGFEAHAWVECDGQVIIGRVGTLEQYARLPSVEPAAGK